MWVQIAWERLRKDAMIKFDHLQWLLKLTVFCVQILYIYSLFDRLQYNGLYLHVIVVRFFFIWVILKVWTICPFQGTKMALFWALSSKSEPFRRPYEREHHVRLSVHSTTCVSFPSNCNAYKRSKHSLSFFTLLSVSYHKQTIKMKFVIALAALLAVACGKQWHCTFLG